MPGTIDQLIIHGPHDEPVSHGLRARKPHSPQNQAKRAALHEWAHAVTEHGGFGRWTWGVSKSPSDLQDVLRAASH